MQKKRCISHSQYVTAKQGLLGNTSVANRLKIKKECQILRPSMVFLTGDNVLKTHAAAARNGGCGLIKVTEIKSGKSRYTEIDGSYGTMLKFYDRPLGARTFRNAEDIPAIENCRIQMIGAGVKEDWKTFVEKSGRLSGMLARVIPVLSHDREMIRLVYEKLPQYDFSLDGLKKVLGIMEVKFHKCSSTEEVPPVTLQFSQSRLDEEFRNTNKLVVGQFKKDGVIAYRGYFRALLDNTSPGAKELSHEASGCGQVSVFLEQMIAEFSPRVKTSGDLTFLRGLEDNILRIAADFFWAFFITKYLNTDGVLVNTQEKLLNRDLDVILQEQVITIPEEIMPYLFSLLRYIVNGVFVLNRFASCSEEDEQAADMIAPDDKSRKRFRLVDRLSQGFGPRKKRKFYISKLDKAIAEMTRAEIEQQIRILKSQAVLTSRSRQSVELERNLNDGALAYLKNECNFSDEHLAKLLNSIELLTN